MADISTFELLVKRIAPIVGNPNNPLNAPFRRAVQSYFLTISNPNNTPVILRVRPRFSALQATSPDDIRDRELFAGPNNNHVYVYDITGGPENGQVFYRPLRCRTQDFNGNQVHMISDNLFLPQGTTGVFILSPNLDPNTTINLADPNFEVRGYIEVVQLRQLIGIINPDGSITFANLGANPVDLYFTPEIRTLFLDNSYPDICNRSNCLDFDHGAYALPTVPGGARIRLEEAREPLNIFCFIFPGGLDIENLTGRLDASGRILLDDRSLGFLKERVDEVNRQQPELGITLAEVRDEVEYNLNQFTVIENDPRLPK